MSEPQNLIQKRGRVKGTVTRVKTFAEGIQDSNTTEEINARLEKLEEAWEEFRQIEDSLLIFPNQVSELDEFEAKYFDTKALLLRARNLRIPSPGSVHSSTIHNDTNNLDSQNHGITTNEQLNAAMTTFLSSQQAFFDRLNQSRSNASNINVPNPSLPKLQIPNFSGDFKEWPSFQDLFENTVDKNESLTSCQKLQYLKGLLKGEAASVIRHLNITENNYQEAWDKLKTRYDKKRNITTAMIKLFMDIHAVAQPSAKQLRTLYDTFDEVIRGLRALGSSAERRDPWLIFIALSKLDSETRLLWSKESSERDFPTIDEFLTFLNKRCDAIENCGDISKKIHTSKAFHASSTVNSPSCPMCKDNHNLFQCPEFKSKLVNDRKQFVINKLICFNCLQMGHSVKACRSKHRCIHCKKSHHSLLHGATKPLKSLSSSTRETSEKVVCSHTAQSSTNISASHDLGTTKLTSINIPHPTINSSSCHFPSDSMSSLNSCVQLQSMNSLQPSVDNPSSLLPTAVVNVQDIYGQSHQCRILLDSGSQLSFITEAFVRLLYLKRSKARIAITGVASSTPCFTKGKVNIKLSSRFDKTSEIMIEAYILPKLTSQLPSMSFNVCTWHCIKNYQLADPYLNQPAPIDLILGADKFFNVLKEGRSNHCNTHPVAQETIFGWVLCGNYPTSASPLSFHSSMLMDIDFTLRKFWETEELMNEEHILSDEEVACEEHFKSTTHRNKDGRYVVSLPFKAFSSPLGHSLHNAIQRFHSVERRFKRDSFYKDQYVKFMQEYQKLGHMEPVSEDELGIESCHTFYLPHHAVFKQTPIPKIRVVFDGSCKSSTGISLNDKLMIGTTVHRDLISILINFRKYSVAFSADIEKMYRQVQMSKSDQNFQRIVWREDSSEPLKHFKLTTVTYGTSSAPFLATRVLKQIALDNQSMFPKAAMIIQQDFYVDDLLSGANSITEAIQLKNELTKILERSGFNLSRWRSNNTAVVSPGCVHEGPLCISDNFQISKVLGIIWNSQEDTFSFDVSPLNDQTPSKRRVLSDSSRLFDPLGLLSPVIITVKIFFQQLWLLKLEWDDPLPTNAATRWNDIIANLHKLSKLRIPRRICTSIENMELHGFSDASELAFSAVVYCRTATDNGQISVNLIAAKTKVAPLQQVSLPRLELCGAVLLVRLMLKLVKALNLKNVKMYGWTDSVIVLSWLSDSPRRWKTYVANRTATILNIMRRNSWGHVPSAQNPADCATRGMSPNHLIECELWWKGPAWLRKTNSSWPTTVTAADAADIKIEERKNPIIRCHQGISTNIIDELSERYSTYMRLVRVISYCLRFTSNCQRRGASRDKGFIKGQELRKATKVIIRCIQHQAFAAEIKCISSGKPLPSKSALISLNPFIDEDQILRVGGRLQNSTINFNAKHPRILPRSHPVTKLIVRAMHFRYLHPGISLLINILRQEYWIIGVRHVVKQITHNCIACFRQKDSTTQQLMGNLPKHRVTVGRPFLRSGVDFAGPINVCTKTGRGVKPFKAYIALFVCFSTKALHLELVSSLSADTFISALRRFVSRRGMPTDMYSDNGTNFVGTSRQLLELHKQALTFFGNNVLITNFLSQHCIRWHFIPPSSPHFGGLWEAGIKSVKSHLRRVIGDATLSFEEMTTLLAQIEAVLNSRPLCPLTDDIDSLDVLTPSHFLIGDMLTTIPEPDVAELKTSKLRRWQHIQAMLQGFWKRWTRDYLTSLQQRPKWKKVQSSLKKGNLVLLSEDNVPPTHWTLARVIEVHPGTDGLIRVVTVKTAKGLYKRSISKVHRLPMEDRCEAS